MKLNDMEYSDMEYQYNTIMTVNETDSETTDMSVLIMKRTVNTAEGITRSILFTPKLTRNFRAYLKYNYMTQADFNIISIVSKRTSKYISLYEYEETTESVYTFKSSDDYLKFMVMFT